MPDIVPQSNQSTDLFKKTSQFFDELYRPVGQPLGQVLGRVARPLGPTWSKAFQSFGEQAPRLATDIALTTRGAPLPKALGFGDVALQSLAETADKGLTTSQRVVPAALQTGAFAAAPRVGTTLGKIGQTMAQPVAKSMPTTLGKLVTGAAERGGSIAGMVSTFEAANAASAAVEGQPYNPLTPEHVAGVAASVLPFEALNVAHNLWYDRLQKKVQGEDAAKSTILTHQREHQLVEDPTLATMPQRQETRPIPPEFFESESKLRGPFALTGPQRVLSEFPGKVNPTQMFGRLQNTLHPDEFKFYEDAGLMDALTRSKTGSEVAKWMQENGPRVEVRTKGQDITKKGMLSLVQERNNLTHQLETRGYQFADPTHLHAEGEFGGAVDLRTYLRDAPEQDRAIIQRILDIDQEHQQTRDVGLEGQSEATNWQSISPKPEREMPGYVEGAVTVKGLMKDQFHPENWKAALASGAHKEGDVSNVEFFPSSHSFPPNTLGFFRGYMETRPDGGKTFHVVEVQSDWDKDVKDYEASEPFQVAPNQHPLLRDWERLTLKAAIEHARKEGADRIAVSDAETAMMTEGHDRAFDGPFISEKEVSTAQGIRSMEDDTIHWTIEKAGDKWYISPHSGGDRLHYDQILPRVLRDLTGQEGKKVEFGEHKMAFEHGLNYNVAFEKQPRKDLIFRAPTGEPKTSISASEFELGKLKGLKTPFSLFGKDKLSTRLTKPLTMQAVNELRRLEDLGMDPQDLVSTAERMAAFERKSGESLVDYLTRKLGIHVDLNKPAKPDELLYGAQQLAQGYARDVLGMDPERADYWTNKYLRFVQMLGSTQKETRILPALPYTKNDQLKAASFYAPSRGNVPNAFIGIFQHTGYSLERAMFEFFHSTGHELFHGALLQSEGKTFTGNMPEKMVESAKNLIKLSDEMKLSTGEMEQSIHSALRMMAGTPYKNILEYRAKHYTEDAEGRTEYLADLFGLIGMGAASPRKLGGFKMIDDLLKFTNDDVREFARGMFKDIGTLWDFMRDMLKKVFGWKPSSIKIVDDIVDNMKKLIQSGDEADKAVEAFLRTQEIRDARPWAPVTGVDYDRVEQLYRAIGAEATDEDVQSFRKEAAPLIVPMTDKNVPDVGLGKRLRWIDFLNPQLWRSIPEWADVKWLGRNLQNLEREASMAMFSQYLDPVTNKYDIDRMVHVARTGTKLNKAANAVFLRQNALSGDSEGQRLSMSQVNEMPEVKALSPEDKTFFDRYLDQTSAAMHEAAVRHVNRMKWRISHLVGSAFQNISPGIRAEEAEKLGKALTDKYVDVDRLNGGPQADPKLWADVQKAQVVLDEWAARDPLNASRLASIAEIFTTGDGGDALKEGEIPNITKKFMEFRGKLLGPWEAPKTPGELWHFRGKPGYTPEVRLGRWTLAWKEKDGQDNLIAFDKKDAFDKKLAALNKSNQAGKLDYLKAFDKEDQKDLFRGLRPDMYNTFVDAVTAANNRVIAKINQLNPGNTELLNELRDELKPARSIVDALIEAPYLKQRRLIGGRETLNMMQGIVHYINSTAHTVGSSFARGQQRLFLNDPQMTQNPNLRKYARQYFTEVTDPTERGFGWFKNLMSLNYIFFSPSLAFVEFTQQMTNHFPALLNSGMKASDAIKAIISSNKEMVEATIKGGFKNHIYSTPEKTAAVKWAVQNKIIDSGWLSELFNLDEDLPFINARNHLVGSGEILDRTGLIGKPLYHLFKAGRDAHGLAIRVNQEAAFTSAWEFLRTQTDPKTGKKYEGQSLLRVAAEMTDESMHGGGRASRPLWYLGVGQPNFGANAGGLMYFLQTYVYSTVSQLCRYSKNAIANSGLSEKERVSAMKAASAMIGSQMFLAGVMGLPIMAQVFALIEQAFPGTEPKRRAREQFFGLGKWLNSKVHLAGQDEDMGHFVADTAIDGLMSQLTPWNMSNRFELGVLLGVDPYRGFNWKNVVGPGGDLLEQLLLKPAQALSEGHVADAAIEALPNSNVRRLLTLASNGWKLRNKDDRMNLDLTDAESTGLALGFTPRRVAEFRQLNEMKKRAEKVESLHQKQFHEQMAGMLMNGQAGEVRSALLKRAHDVENYDPREGARRIAELVQQRTEEFDPTRTGSRVGETYNVAKLFPSRPTSTSEAQRLVQRQNLTQALGFPQGLTRSSLREAALVDQLLALHPTMTRLEARAMLERQLHPARYIYSVMGP